MSIKCLIAENAAFIRQIYRLNLQSVPDLEVVAEAQDGAEALRLLGEIKPQLLILELVLPKKSGVEVLQALHDISPDTKVIVISSLDDDEAKKRAKALGVLAYLPKPFTRAQLLGAVEEACRTYAGVQNG